MGFYISRLCSALDCSGVSGDDYRDARDYLRVGHLEFVSGRCSYRSIVSSRRSGCARNISVRVVTEPSCVGAQLPGGDKAQAGPSFAGSFAQHAVDRIGKVDPVGRHTCCEGPAVESDEGQQYCGSLRVVGGCRLRAAENAYDAVRLRGLYCGGAGVSVTC